MTKRSISLADLAIQIGAQLDESSPKEVQIIGIASLKRAKPQEVSFFSNSKLHKELAQTKAGAVILTPRNRKFCKGAALLMENPYLGYARVATLFNTPIPQPSGIHPSAWVSHEAYLEGTVSVAPKAVIEANASLGHNVFVGAGCVIGRDVEVGDDCQLMANVTLCPGTCLGQRVIIHPGAVIGSDGFGNANDNGKWIKVPQLGGVSIADDVEIGANTTIDKGTLENTVIAQGVKLDNQIQIGHNVHIGDHTAIAGCVGIAGSTHIGRYCMIGGGVGIAGHLELVDHVHVTGGSIVLQSIRKPGTYSSGTALEPNSHWHRNYHRFKQLDEMARRLQTLEKELKRREL